MTEVVLVLEETKDQRKIYDRTRREGLYQPSTEHDSCGVGFIVHMKGEKSHDIIEKALLALNHLSHRGACGCEVNTGDGAGILIQVPHAFLAREFNKLGIALPKEG